MLKSKKLFARILAIAVAIPVLAVSVSAMAQGSKVSTSVGYLVKGPATEGTLVATDNSTAGAVKAATTQTANDLVGVVVAPEEPLLTISSGSNQRQVAISGVAYALVTDSNGDVKKGDYISVSTIAGVGMKATTSGRVLGLAQSDFSSATNVQTTHIGNATGPDSTVKIGRILVLVNIGFYSGPANSGHSLIPQSVQEFANNLVGRQVSPIRIVMSFLLLIVALIVSVTLVYSAVRSSIISIGRNPLSKSPVRKSLIQILGLVGIILLVTLISVYLILSK